MVTSVIFSRLRSLEQQLFQCDSSFPSHNPQHHLEPSTCRPPTLRINCHCIEDYHGLRQEELGLVGQGGGGRANDGIHDLLSSGAGTGDSAPSLSRLGSAPSSSCPPSTSWSPPPPPSSSPPAPPTLLHDLSVSWDYTRSLPLGSARSWPSSTSWTMSSS